MPGATYDQTDVELVPGALLLIFSDGVTDTLNMQGESMGEQKLADLIADMSGRSAEEVLQAIDFQSRRFRGDAEPFDDFTVLTIKAVEAGNETISDN